MCVVSEFFFAHYFEGGQNLSVSVKKNLTLTCDKNLRFNLIGCDLSFQTRGREVEPLCIFLITFFSNLSHSLIVFVCFFCV